MLSTMISLDCNTSLRDKARLNICIARDLAESFGGSKTDYLKRLNQKLKIRIAAQSNSPNNYLAKPLSIPFRIF